MDVGHIQCLIDFIVEHKGQYWNKEPESAPLSNITKEEQGGKENIFVLGINNAAQDLTTGWQFGTGDGVILTGDTEAQTKNQAATGRATGTSLWGQHYKRAGSWGGLCCVVPENEKDTS